MPNDMSDDMPYYEQNDYTTGRQDGVLDAVGGLPNRTFDMPNKSYFYISGYREGYAWARDQLALDFSNSEE